ncbi:MULTISPECIES: MFS transporter [Burkholderiaceae]|uniref:MFS transporter n=1 Tax=Paraburkholderia TaxID=1822464 RepID=UPI0006B4B90E|nr:MFS transporter [Burkholderia sp. ST111]MBK5153485.1 MHS family MFS transporter [Burkholderia sp. R-69608]MBK5185572.1 MHS family MFS transporter [Burkholderia sp. R-69749]CAE6881262.1 Fosfomycin resistance protein AbaF [Paraburkholderia domus]CAE6972304.1 Fosfomycin resistance protein AbaF [Paraburkholderia nemoris]
MENTPAILQDEGDIALAQTPQRTRMGRLAAASSIGTTLEWYDFTVYNLMAALVFNSVFFPSFDPLSGTILAFSTYAVGYLSRPFGGVIFGHLGDKLGRRFVLVATLVLMGLATGLMGLLPTYRVWGVWSPILLVSLRFLQGAAIGGEWAGAVLLSMEHGNQHKRGRNASFAQVGPACGTLLGAGFITLFTYFLSPESFQTWGWRIPFLSSAVLVIFGLWLRRGVDETPMFKELERHHHKVQLPIKEVVVGHWKRLLIAGSVRIGSDIVYGLLVVFTLTYVTNVLHLPRSLALTATMLGAVLHAVCVPFFGALCDRLGRRVVYGAGALFSIVWAFIYFALMATLQPLLICVAVVVGMLFQAMMYGPQASFVTEQFPTRVRYAGASLSATLGGIIGGGFAPLVFVSLYKTYQSTTFISVYIAAGLLITLIALASAKETAGKPLEE